jgi:predicted dehydrogenase
MEIGMIGIGRWGINLLRNFDRTATVSIACHTGSAANKQRINDQFPSVEVTNNCTQVFNSQSVDAIAIATPIRTHYEFAKRGIEAGKHIFVEKPLANNVKRAEELQHLAEHGGVTLFVGYIFAYHPLIRRLAAIHERDRITTAWFSWEKFGAFSEDIFLELVCHPVSIFQYLIGDKPDSVHDCGGLSYSDGRDIVTATLSYEEMTVKLSINRTSPHNQKSLVVRTESGSKYAWTDDQLYQLFPTDGVRKVIAERDKEPLYSECRAFVEAINTGKEFPTDGEFGVSVNQTLSAFGE